MRLIDRVMFQPCYMVKDGEKRQVFYSIDFLELTREGWKQVSKKDEAKIEARKSVQTSRKRFEKIKADEQLKEYKKQNPVDISSNQAEVYVEAGVPAYSTDALKVEEEEEEDDFVAAKAEPEEAGEADETDFHSMTKQQLLNWAEQHGHDLRNNDRKADILLQCEEIYKGL